VGDAAPQYSGGPCCASARPARACFTLLAGLESKRRDLGGRKPHPRDRVDPPLGKRPPRPLDFQCRDVCLAEERRELVEPLDHDMTTTKPTTQRREGDTVLGINGIDGGVKSDNVQEPSDFADPRCR
jgi:hypothetical protein